MARIRRSTEDSSRTYPTRSHCPAVKSDPKPLASLLNLIASLREAGLQSFMRLQQFERLIAPVDAEVLPGPMEQLLWCQICSQRFDVDARLPVVLPCGHTLCKDCVIMIRKTGYRALCPYDRKDFSLFAGSLQANSAVLELVQARAQGSKTVCTIHQHPYVGFCLVTKQLKCGICLLTEKDNYCVPLDAYEVESYKEDVRIELSRTIERGSAAIALWRHAEELLAMFLEEQKELGYSCKQVAILLENLFDVAQDLAELITLITASLANHLQGLQSFEQTWGSLTLVQQLSTPIHQAFGQDEAVELLRLCENLLKVRAEVE